jgi:hypothetical protein
MIVTLDERLKSLEQRDDERLLVEALPIEESKRPLSQYEPVMKPYMDDSLPFEEYLKTLIRSTNLQAP